MTGLFIFAAILNGLLLPAIAAGTLITAKLSRGATARRAERQFLAALIVMTIITLRTVIRCDDLWLLHTATLGLMIVGSLVIPGQRPSIAIG